MDSPARASATPLSPPRRQRRSGRLSKGRRRLLIALLGLLTVGIALYSIDRLLAHTLCRGGSWSGAPSDHFDGKRFHNVFPGTAVIHGTGSGFKWLFGMSERGLYPRVSENAYRPELAPSVDGPDWECTMVNHSTMLIRTAGLNILTDPVWSDYVSPVQGVGPARHRPPGITRAGSRAMAPFGTPAAASPYSLSRSMTRPSMIVFTVRMAHILPHMVHVPSLDGGALSK